MALDKVRKYFAAYGIDDRILEFNTSSATVELAAVAVGCEAKRIAKTMAYGIDDGPILIVVAGDARIDNSKYKGYFNTKAKMIHAEELSNIIGHEMGGVCPFAIKDGVEVYLDESLKRFSTVFPAAGSSNSAIELTLDELEHYSAAKSWVDVCKDWDQV